jgi:succinate-semialdehyde dehydrogenase/glutarate-semialdehyde dehydrogenase
MDVLAINPATGEICNSYNFESDRQVLSKLEAAKLDPQTLSERLLSLENLKSDLIEDSQKFADGITLEMGKPITQALAEINKCAALCDYYIETAATSLAEESIATQYAESFVTHQPLGTILGIMPWNFPFWQVFRFAVPTLLAGNKVMLKHAENVQLSANNLERLFQNHFGSRAYQNLCISVSQTEKLIASPHIRGVSLTGSTSAGRRVASLAGHSLKPSVLELGGSDPYLVLSGCEIPSTAETICKGRFLNAGQSCISPKRIIVERPILPEFIDNLKKQIESFAPSDPTDRNCQLGPLAREDLRQNLDRQVQETKKQGAKCLIGGKVQEGPGFFYLPTLLTDVTPSMTAFKEELFGPVAVVISCETLAHAIEMANDSEFGLGAAIFTSATKLEEARDIAKTQLDTGCCFVNDFVKSDPALPFGGTKQSGYGRELAKQGLLAFTNTKTVALGA